MNNIFFLIAGVGLGNATRVEALLQYAHNSKCNITVFAWGTSYGYLRHKLAGSTNISLVRLIKQRRKSEMKNTFSFFIRLIKVYLKNTKKINKETKRAKPKIAVLDSDFHFWPFFYNRVPIVSISQAPYVVLNFFRYYKKKKNLSFILSFFFTEVAESIANLIFAKKIICPVFSFEYCFPKKIISVAPIVRKEFLQVEAIAEGTDVGVLSGGSKIELNELIKLAKKNKIKYYGRSTTELRDIDSQTVKNLRMCHTVVSQAGFSTISELIALRKYMVLKPIRNHPEQNINAAVIEALDWGRTYEGWDKIANTKTSSNIYPDCNGARDTWRHLEAILENVHQTYLNN